MFLIYLLIPFVFVTFFKCKINQCYLILTIEKRLKALVACNHYYLGLLQLFLIIKISPISKAAPRTPPTTYGIKLLASSSVFATEKFGS